MPTKSSTGSNSFQELLPNVARIGSADSEQSRTSAVALTSTLERVITFKDEERNWMEVEVEHAACADYPPQAMDLGSSSAGQQSNSEVSKENEKYYEGCLVMGQVEDWPHWPGMIRKPDEGSDDNDDEYVCEDEGKLYFYVQFFGEPTGWKWLTARDLKVFDGGVETETLEDPDSDVVERYAKGIKIAKAASKFSVEDRLAKFTFRNGTPIGNLLEEIYNVNSKYTTNSTPPPQNDRITSTTKENVKSSIISVAKVKQRMLDTRRKLRETEEANEGLTAENSKLWEKIDELEATVQGLKRRLKSNGSASTKITALEQKLKMKNSELKTHEKEVLELRENLEKERKDKLEYQEELEKIRSEVQALEELSNDE